MNQEPQTLEQIAAFWSDQYPKGDIGYCEPSEASWHYHENFDVLVLGDATEWKEWFDSEVQMWASEGQPERYQDLLDEPIYQEIIILKRDDEYYLWDGNHRVGAAFTKEHYFLKAIVGTPLYEYKSNHTHKPK